MCSSDLKRGRERGRGRGRPDRDRSHESAARAEKFVSRERSDHHERPARPQREERAASFIWHNMPQSAPGSLQPQEAFDLAAFINTHPRPDSPGKEGDWPMGGAPKDVPYATKGHEPHRPPASLVTRQNTAGALVPNPPSVLRKGDK